MSLSSRYIENCQRYCNYKANALKQSELQCGVCSKRYTPPRTVRALPPLRRKPSGSLRPEPFPEHCDRYQSDFLLDLRGLVSLRDWKMRRCSSSNMSSEKEVVLKPHPTLTLKGIVKRAHIWWQACHMVYAGSQEARR